MEHKFKTTNIKGKDYVEVNERIKYFRRSEDFKGWSMESEIIKQEPISVTIKTTIRNSDGIVISTGIAHEYVMSSNINNTSHVENCETSANGRALGNLGIGIDKSIATYEEVRNAINNQRGPNNIQKTQEKPYLLSNSEKFEEAMSFIKEGGDIDKIKNKYILSESTEKKLLESL